MIPENILNEVRKALQSTFGTGTYDDLELQTTGLSNALVLRIVVKGKPYLLKIARTDSLSDPTLYYYSCMRSAAEAGIAPKVWYAGVEDGISITDFVALKPFPLSEATTKVAIVLGRLHSISPFSKTIHAIDTFNMFAHRFREAKILPGPETDTLFQELGKITNVYPRNKEDLVPSHNDLKPENILYDGNKVWLSDWEAAFNNDRYSDLSIVANFVVRDETDERRFLSHYFGRKATDYEWARFYLMRQIMHMSYVTVFLVIVAAKGKKIDLNDVAKHDFREFHDRMWAGEVDLALDESRLEYAAVHLNQLRLNLQTRKFEDALKLVTGAKSEQ
jgi:hypothetical protein